MAVALIFPPAVDPRAPQLALPSLAAFLRKNGVEVRLFDDNASSMRGLLTEPSLRAAGETLERSLGLPLDPVTPRARLAAMAPRIAASMGEALATLSDDDRFFDAHAFADARELVAAGLDLSAAALHPRLSYNVAPAHYDLEGIDPQRLGDLIAVTETDAFNLFAGLWRQHLFAELARDPPELVGISITNRQQIIPGLTMARRLRERGHFVVIGGAVFTKFADGLRRLPAFFEHFADAVVVYEGETALLALVEEMRTNRRLENVPNLLYLDARGAVAATTTHVEDVNALPTPDFEGFDLAAYLSPRTVLPILTGKGCYFNRCKFCDIPYINHISKKAYRVRSVEQIVADVDALHERFGCRHFVITDEALSPRLLSALADALDRPEPRDYAFTGYARLEAGFTPPVCSRLREMGMKKLFFGLESADQQTLDHMDKGIRVERAIEVLRNCREAGIDYHLFSIIGFPGEPESSARTTLRFFLDHRELFDTPSVSFDIHPFGLELRTEYFADRKQLGLTVLPSALDKDFVIGVGGSDWGNPSGLDAAQVETLLETEFHPALRAAFRSFHATPEPIWPGFEEYAVLYADHYRDRPFPFRTSIPREQGPLAVDWSRALARLADEDEVLLLQRHRGLVVTRATYRQLRARKVERLAALVAMSVDEDGASSMDSERLDWLVAQGYLRLRLLPT